MKSERSGEDPARSENGHVDMTFSARRRLMAAVLAMSFAAGIAAAFLAHGVSGPFGPQAGPGNLVFWVVIGMGVGLAFRTGLAWTARVAELPIAHDD
jgi:hypothetical protein